MKKLVPVVVTVLMITIIAIITISQGKKQKVLTIYEGNHTQQPVAVTLGHYQDTQCAMFIEELKDSAQAVDSHGRTWFFDDIGCLALWLDKNSMRDEMVLWAYSRDTEEWINAREAWYSCVDKTPMDYGFAAYKNRLEAFISFENVSVKMLRGENLTNPYVRKELLGND